MDAKAKQLAARLHSPEHWAKPFYSDIHLFKPRPRRVLVGINSKGNRYSRQYDLDQDNEAKMWSGKRPLHNAYLDECWGNKPDQLDPKGQSDLQVAVQRVFKAIYGNHWERRLRGTPCFNLVPVSSDGVKDPMLGKVWNEGACWGTSLIDHLRPQSIILFGNSHVGRSVWAALKQKYSLEDCVACTSTPPNYRLEICYLRNEPLSGAPVVSLPHLSMLKGRNLDSLCRKLHEMVASLTPP